VFNDDTFIGFLKQLLRYYDGRKIHIIMDNVEYHQSPKVGDWLTGKEDLIELHFPLPYSPKLNAVEYVWKKTMKKITHNKYFAKLNNLKEALARPFNRFQSNPASLRTVIPHFV